MFSLILILKGLGWLFLFHVSTQLSFPEQERALRPHVASTCSIAFKDLLTKDILLARVLFNCDYILIISIKFVPSKVQAS